MSNVVRLDTNKKQRQIEQQEKRAADALLKASQEFKALAAMKADH